ncbi:MAG: exopolysaccharide biosynthesis polyprenyl glycosylphosphotransferase [Clostridiales bacterium]|nr:exopolysaccharide biosynthesis polyprenyl glycosylphosphotransferase [Clostridiales bacterium]
MNAKNNMLRLAEFVGDVVIVYFSLVFAHIFSPHNSFSVGMDSRLLICIEISTVFFLYMFDMYQDKAVRRGELAVSVALSVIAAVVCSFIAGLILKIPDVGVGTGVFWMIFSLVLVCSLEMWRLLLSLIFIRFKKKERILILESAAHSSSVARKIKYAHTNVNSAYYYMIDESEEDEVESLINNILPQYDIIFISPNIEKQLSDRLVVKSLLLGKKINILAKTDYAATMNASIRQYEDTAVIEKDGILISKFAAFIKRLFDLVVASVFLVVTAPLMLISALAVKLDTPGPVIYKQERYTIGKKRFNIYKFRTMVADAEKNGAVLAGENDSRITRSGKFLRAVRLDELPQLINIIRGDMSIVGPRPERPVFADEFCKKIPEYELRYLVKAGLTGYAQVYGKYNTRVEDKILMDIIYELNYSFFLDLKIIVLTLKTMLSSEATQGVSEREDTLSSVKHEERRRLVSKTLINSDNKPGGGTHTGYASAKVSIIIPAYNCEMYIDKCLESVFAQHYPNIEVIVVNDGSTDGTGEHLEKYKDRIRLINAEHGGSSRARNIGLENARGDFILFLDADDYYEKNTIRDLVEFQEETDADIIHFGYKLISPTGRITFPDDNFRCDVKIEKADFAKEIYPYFIKGITLNSACFALYKRSCIENLRFATDMKTAEDAVFNLNAYTNAQSVASLGLPYYCYVQHNKGLKGLSIAKKCVYNLKYSMEMIKFLDKWGMNTLYWKMRAFIRSVV